MLSGSIERQQWYKMREEVFYYFRNIEEVEVYLELSQTSKMKLFAKIVILILKWATTNDF